MHIDHLDNTLRNTLSKSRIQDIYKLNQKIMRYDAQFGSEQGMQKLFEKKYKLVEVSAKISKPGRHLLHYSSPGPEHT
jgi:transcriptional accessory protein Tex/SPT6